MSGFDTLARLAQVLLGFARYHPRTLARFLFLALPLLVLALAAGHGILTTVGGVNLGALPPLVRLGTWMLEAIALTALFLLIHGEVGRPKDPDNSPVVTGVLAAWIAWVFRGALLVLSLAAAGQATTIWWRRALGWWAIYTVCGVVLGALARSPKRERELP